MNYYHILGVPEDATQAEIRDAYRNMIKAFHPDYYRGSDTEFSKRKTRELIEAYEVLRDPEKRADYDALLRTQNSSSYSSCEKSYSYDNDVDSEEEETDEETEPETTDQEEEPPKQKNIPKGKKAIIAVAIIIIALFGVNEFHTFLGFTLFNSQEQESEKHVSPEYVVDPQAPMVGTWEYSYPFAIKGNEELESPYVDEDITATIVIHQGGTYDFTLNGTECSGTWGVDSQGRFKIKTYDGNHDNTNLQLAIRILSKGLYQEEDDTMWFGFYDKTNSINYFFVFERK